MLLDNKIHGKVGEALLKNLLPKTEVSIISKSFSIYGFSALKDRLSQIANVRLVVPPDTPHNPFRLANLTGVQSERRFRNGLNAGAIARECAGWLKDKGEIKSISSVAQNLFHLIHPNQKAIAIYGSSPLTSEGLGLVASPSYEMNTLVETTSETQGLLDWFESIWNNPEATCDVKDQVLAQLEEIYSPKSPEWIYFLTLYHLFWELHSELEEDKIIKTRTGIKDTLIWKKLYKFQRDGVLGAIDKIEKYNGCIIADSVGLGKTFEALAIIKYYELRNDRVLVICPKKLRENWTIYTVNDRRNILSGDRFNYDVLNHTDLTRVRGKSGEINLKTLNWANYDLIVIDESHNFRNNNPPKKDGLTRYRRLMRDVIQAGVKTKVLMLSATPVNSRMNDLKNQVAFITEGIDTALDFAGIQSIEQTLKRAQTRFNRWLDLASENRTTESLLESLNFDYFKLLDLLTIARSRKHIEKYYDISEVGEFPERARPINIKADIDTRDKYPPLQEVNRNIRRLHLSAYAPLKYVLPGKVEKYNRKYDMKLSQGSVFRQIDREQSLIHLMRVNLLKRMESSINSFALTVEKLLNTARHLIERIDTHEEMDIAEMDIEKMDVESEEFTPFLIGKKVKVLIGDMDRIRWKQELKEDTALLLKLLGEAQKIKAPRDEKLRQLKQLIAQKINHPINSNSLGGNKKIIIFTAFADTARYLYHNIADWAHQSLQIHSALVTGAGPNKTTMAGIRHDIADILTAFSPRSKERSKISPSQTEEIDLLIATDCVSEGQNLQDCDYLINYDIHWNPLRIIQRFGRIDRIGSQNQVIQLVNFWPNMELDEYINLEARVSGRMVLLDISATGEENVIEGEYTGKMRDLEYRRKQFEQIQNQVIDMEDLSHGISITDLTLNDFRMDLADYLKVHSERLEHTEPGAFSVTLPPSSSEENLQSGVIFCLRDENAKMKMDHYGLSPFYLVYVSDSGEILLNFSQAKKILDIFKKISQGTSQPDQPAMEIFKAHTDNGADMSHYQALLAKALLSITGKAEEIGVESLFHPGGTALTRDSFQGIDDFEVVAYLILEKGK